MGRETDGASDEIHGADAKRRLAGDPQPGADLPDPGRGESILGANAWHRGAQHARSETNGARLGARLGAGGSRAELEHRIAATPRRSPGLNRQHAVASPSACPAKHFATALCNDVEEYAVPQKADGRDRLRVSLALIPCVMRSAEGPCFGSCGGADLDAEGSTL